MVMLDNTSLDTIHNVPDVLASQSYLTFFQDQSENVKILRFLDLQLIFNSNDFKSFIPFSNLQYFSVAI